MRLFKPNFKKLTQNADVPGLIKLLHDSDWEVRRDAALALGEVGDRGAVDTLIDALKSEQEQLVRKGIIGALGEIGDRRALGTLIDIVKYERPSLIAAACEAVGNLRAEEGVAPLIEAMDTANDLVRTKAALALGEIGDARSAPAIIAAFDHPNVDSRLACYHALKQLSYTSIPAGLVTSLVRSLANRIYELYNQRQVMPGDARTGYLSGGEMRRRAVLKEAKSKKNLREFVEAIPPELLERVKQETSMDVWGQW